MNITERELRLLFNLNIHHFWITKQSSWNRNVLSVILSVEIFNRYVTQGFISALNFPKLKDFMKTEFDIEIQSEKFKQWGRCFHKIESIS